MNEKDISQEITIQDCINYYVDNGYSVILNDGKVVDFIKE